MKLPLVLISGWAHPASALQNLAKALSQRFDPQVLSAGQFFSGNLPLEPGSQAWILGWSLGGLLALEAALTRPDSVSKNRPAAGLILLSSTARFTRCDGYPQGTEPANLRALQRALKGDPIAALWRFMADCASPRSLAAQELEDLSRTALSQGIDALEEGLRRLQDLDLRERARSLRMPCLLIHGREDLVIPWRASEWLASQIAGSLLQVIDGAGHDLPLHNPGLVADRVLRFAAEVMP